jgi:hypothetical protein
MTAIYQHPKRGQLASFKKNEAFAANVIESARD